ATTGTRGGGYFDVHIRFPASGQVRLQWTYPLESLTPPGYPNGGTPQGLLPALDNGATIYSRSFAIRVH
ncbi:MAG TPA: hypothetical protein VFN55_00800, partial [Solirubrobacteraceae bacterium]|nr:hypothetical protein [Solirubrobacteraceae bacterium]